MIPERRVLWITCRLKSVPYHFASLHAVSGSIQQPHATHVHQCSFLLQVIHKKNTQQMWPFVIYMSAKFEGNPYIHVHRTFNFHVQLYFYVHYMCCIYQYTPFVVGKDREKGQREGIEKRDREKGQREGIERRDREKGQREGIERRDREKGVVALQHFANCVKSRRRERRFSILAVQLSSVPVSNKTKGSGAAGYIQCFQQKLPTYLPTYKRTPTSIDTKEPMNLDIFMVMTVFGSLASARVKITTLIYMLEKHETMKTP